MIGSWLALSSVFGSLPASAAKSQTFFHDLVKLSMLRSPDVERDLPWYAIFLGYPVLMSQEVASLSSHSLTAVGRHSLRGTAQPVALFTLPELESEGGRTVATD